MKITKAEAHMILATLDKVPVQGIAVQKQVLSLCIKLEEFIKEEESSGDDVPEPAE